MTKELYDSDKQAIIKRYTNRYNQYGYSPKSLGWDKGKQDIRFSVLTSQYDFTSKSVLDIGCGFGDLNQVLQEKYQDSYEYTGVDIVPCLIDEACIRYPDKQFIIGDFLEIDFYNKFDYVVASGIFNHILKNSGNYEFISSVIRKGMAVSRDGLAFDFLSDKVDFRLDHTFHSSPERIISIAYNYSRNIVLRNDYMPFEFSLFIFNNDSFLTEDTLFQRYKQLRPGATSIS